MPPDLLNFQVLLHFWASLNLIWAMKIPSELRTWYIGSLLVHEQGVTHIDITAQRILCTFIYISAGKYTVENDRKKKKI